MDQLPHLLIFNPDQWRGDVLGHLGNPAAVTPNLDRLVATEAVSFSQTHCQNPVCTPSRCSFMTGWYPHVRGHRTMFHMLHPERDEPNLLKLLKDRGYFIWWGGKNDLAPGQDGYEAYCDIKFQAKATRRDLHNWTDWRGKPGSDTYYSFFCGKLDKGESETYDDTEWATVRGAIDFLRNPPPEAAGKPLCLFMPLSYPHPPYGVEEPYFSAIDRGAIPPRIPAPTDWTGKPSLLKGLHRLQNMATWTEDRWTELRATYYGMCARVDDQFGRMIQALRDTGRYDQTGIFFFSDHGDFTGDYGLVEKTQNTFQDCLTRVPLIVKPPAGVPVKPRVSAALTELIDFTATVYDFAGITPPYTHFGRSLRPVLAGETDAHRDAVFCEGGRLKGETHCMELQSTSSRNTEGLYYPRLALQTQDDGPEHTKAVMCRTSDYKYVRRLYESDELYDLRADPGETVNRIDDPALAPVLAAMRDRMLTFFLETGDVVPFTPDRRW